MTKSRLIPQIVALALAFVPFRAVWCQAKPLDARDFAVAGITLGMDSASVRKILGSPDSAAEGSDPSLAGPLPSWYYPHIQIVYLDSSVHGIWLLTSQLATARGLEVGDSVVQARRLYGRPTGGSTIPPGLSWGAKVRGDWAMIYATCDSVHITALYLGHSID